MQKSLFITIEGTDGSGKATQTNLLVERLEKQGQQVEQISFPRYGERSAAMVEDYLNGKFGSPQEVTPYQCSTFYAIDRFAASPQIKEWLAQGKTVIANRYVASNMGHQGGKIKDKVEREKYFAWNYNLEYNIFKLPKPDVNLVLHVTPEISQQLVDKKEERKYLNGKKRDIHEDDLDHLKDAEQSFLHVVELYPEFELIECLEDNKILSAKIIHEKVWKKIIKKI